MCGLVCELHRRAPRGPTATHASVRTASWSEAPSVPAGAWSSIGSSSAPSASAVACRSATLRWAAASFRARAASRTSYGPATCAAPDRSPSRRRRTSAASPSSGRPMKRASAATKSTDRATTTAIVKRALRVSATAASLIDPAASVTSVPAAPTRSRCSCDEVRPASNTVTMSSTRGRMSAPTGSLPGRPSTTEVTKTILECRSRRWRRRPMPRSWPMRDGRRGNRPLRSCSTRSRRLPIERTLLDDDLRAPVSAESSPENSVPK